MKTEIRQSAIDEKRGAFILAVLVEGTWRAHALIYYGPDRLVIDSQTALEELEHIRSYLPLKYSDERTKAEH